MNQSNKVSQTGIATRGQVLLPLLASWCAVALLGLAAPALSESPELQKALQLYDSLDYLPALDALQAADARPDTTRPERVQIQLYTGMIAVSLGDEAKARAAFKKAVALDPSVQAPAEASPKVGELLDEARASTAQPSPQAPTSPVPVAAPAPPEAVASRPAGKPEGWMPVTGWIALSVGAAALAGGAFFVVSSGNEAATARLPSTSASATTRDLASSQTNAALGTAMLVSGGVLAVGGALLVLLQPHPEGAATPALSLGLGGAIFTAAF